jgi:lysophospholipase L1-like esterase
MRKGWATVLLALATTAGFLVAPGPAAHADGQVRIMLAGDSITQGFDGDFTWRYWLAQELGRLQVPFDFVGPHRNPYGGNNAYLATGWDSDHDAKGGTTLAAQLQYVAADMRAYLPDVLVALYGTNDLRNGATTDQLLARWRAYVEQARSVRPDVALVLGEVNSGRIAVRDDANTRLAALAAELSTAESPVLVADLDSPDWVTSRDTYDRTHPTPTGETLIAQRVGEALQALGVLPAAPAIARGFVPWTPPVRAAVHRVGNRLSVDWRASKRRYRAREVRVRWTNVRTGRTVTTSWTRHRTHLRTRPLPRGTFRVEVQARRRTMTSVWGPPVQRRISRAR